MRRVLFFFMLVCKVNAFTSDKTGTMLIQEDTMGINWEVNYVYALEKARAEGKLLLLFFCCPPATDLCCENARSRFINSNSFLEQISNNFIFCIVHPQKNTNAKDVSKSMYIQFLAKLISGGSSSHVIAPSFVIINPRDQKITSGYISANLEDKKLYNIFDSYLQNMIRSCCLQ